MWVALILACTAPGGKDSDSGGTPALEPTFTNVQAEVFSKSCAFSTCHAASGSGGLSLPDAATSYAELVGVPSEQVPEFMRVEAGNPAGSYLYMKLTEDSRITDDPMPPSGVLLEAEKLALIESWIAAGAENN
jgi:hypothetical protein